MPFQSSGLGAVALQFFPKNPTDLMPTTPATKNIQARYSLGGAHPDFTPAGGTPRGDKDTKTSRTVTTEGSGKQRYEKGQEFKTDHS